VKLQVPIYNDIEGIVLHKRIKNYLDRNCVKAKVSNSSETKYPKNTRVIDWDTESGTIPIYEPEASNPYGIEPIRFLIVVAEGTKDELKLMRQLSLILNERPIAFPKEGIRHLWKTTESRAPRFVSASGLAYWNAVHNAIRILERAISELSVLDQFIHFWRSFNALYSYYYKAEIGKDPRKERISEETMFNHFLQKFFGNDSKSKPIVQFFLSRYDLKWMCDLKIEAMALTKEGYLELINKGVIRREKPGKEEEHQWVFEGVDWKEFLTFRKGLEFWDYYNRKDFPSALKEVIAFIYDAGRSKLFHGSEPYFIEEELAFLHASAETLYQLLVTSMPKILETA